MRKITLSIYAKYMISFAVVFIIPFLILGSIMFLSFSHLFKREIDRNSIEMLSSAQTVIDARIMELNNIATQIDVNPDLHSTRMLLSYTNVINAVSILNNISLTNTFYDEIFVYYKDSSLIYSSKGTYRIDYFLKHIYKYENRSIDEFKINIENLSSISVSPAEKADASGGLEQNTKFVTYIVPLSNNRTKTVGAVFYRINENKFNTSLKNTLSVKNGSVMVISPEGQAVISNGDNDDFDPALLSPEIFNEKKYTAQQIIKGRSYSVSSLRSDLTGWTYIALFPVSEVYAKLAPILTIALIGFVLVVSSGFAVIYYLTRVNYKPIRELVRFVLNSYSEPNSGSKNEIETVKTTVDKMTGVINTLQKKFESSIPGIRNNLLTRIIKGYYSEIDTLEKEASEAGVNFQGDYFGIMAFILHSENAGLKTAALEFIEAYHAENIQIYCIDSIDSMDRNQIVAVFCINQSAGGLVPSTISGMALSLQNDYKLQITIGVGKPVTDIRNLGNSYLEASAALDYRFIRGKNTVILYEELENQSNDMDYYPKEKFQSLEINILKADPKNVLNILAELFEEMKSKKLPVFHARSLSYNLVNSIFNSIFQLKGAINLRDYRYSDITSLARLETIDELSFEIGKFCMLVCSVVLQNRNELSKSKIEQIREYILFHFTAVDFSLQTMADEFKMSVSGLSSYFKAGTGENISDYVNHLKIDLAKKLLLETDDSLQTIVNKIGYVNVSSFIRKFRESTDTTPGNYRNLMKSQY